MIETPRIQLRRFRPSDAAAVLEFGSDPEVMRYTGDALVRDLDHAGQIINDIWQAEYEAYGYGRLAAYHKDDRRVIGFSGFKYLPELGFPDLGYRILPDYWNQGLATEMATALIDYGFHTLELPEVYGFVLPENLASIRVLEKAGFQFQKQAPYPGDDPHTDPNPECCGNLCNWYHAARTSHGS